MILWPVSIRHKITSEQQVYGLDIAAMAWQLLRSLFVNFITSPKTKFLSISSLNLEVSKQRLNLYILDIGNKSALSKTDK